MSVSINGQGTVTINPPGGTYPMGTQVTITANPASSWAFLGWSRDVTGSQTPLTITMNFNKNITATFAQAFTITTSVQGQGSITLNPPGGTYAEGTKVTITAAPAPDWQFLGWSGDLSDPTNPAPIPQNPITITVTSDMKNIIGIFEKGFSITTSVQGQGGISLSPSGSIHEAGSQVTITATPAPGWRLLEWLVDQSSIGSPNPITITLTANKSVVAVFVQVPAP